MRPIPFVPDSAVLYFAETPPGHSRRLELWNLLPVNAADQLDYICLSLVPDSGLDPYAMVVTRLPRTPDHALDSAVGPARAVPAAEQSVLTIPLDQWLADGSYGTDRLTVSKALLAALAAGQAPWEPSTCLIDGDSFNWWVLRWSDGALWVGEYRDVTASAITPVADILKLRPLAPAEKTQLSQGQPLGL